jgi:ABC-type bacteriocin/lantibiotic exporter with double-glycine peptidase domain
MLSAFLDLFTDDDEVIGTLDFPRRIQWDRYSCGARCALAIAEHFGVDADYDDVAAAVNLTEKGTSRTPIMRFLRGCGLRVSYREHMSWAQLEAALGKDSVVLVDLDGDHWSVVHAVNEDYVWMANPSLRQQLGRRVDREDFEARWTGLGVSVGATRRRRRK